VVTRSHVFSLFLGLGLSLTLPISLGFPSTFAGARVIGIQNAGVGDLVLIDGGAESGFRYGMSCVVSGERNISTGILLTEVRFCYSSALIVDVQSKQRIRVGDLVSVKTLKSEI
jgi:hypothetical protein